MTTNICLQEPTDGAVFASSTCNGFRNESFDHNIYFARNSTSPIGFPCRPTSVLEEDRNLTVGEMLQSKSGAAMAVLQADGNFCIRGTGKQRPRWCADDVSYPGGKFHAYIDGVNARFCVVDDSNGTNVFCSPVPHRHRTAEHSASSSLASSYYAVLGNDCSFCLRRGTPSNDQGEVWCAVKAGSGCAHGDSETSDALDNVLGGKSDARWTETHANTGTNCPYTDWTASGHDTHSLVGTDPMFEDADERIFSIKPGSPALALGITSIDTSNVGPQL